MFNDVSFTNRSCDTCDLLSLLSSKLTNYICIINTWDTKNKTYYCTAPHILKKSGSYEYIDAVLSHEALVADISYVQVKVITLNGGSMFFGLSKNNDAGFYDYTYPSKTMGMLSSDTKSTEFCTVLHTFEIDDGDLLGVVVDKTKNEQRFYVNGKLVMIGKREISRMEPIYAVMWLFESDSEVGTDYYLSYSELKN